MSVLEIIIVFVSCLYFLLLAWFFKGIASLPYFVKDNDAPKTKFSIIIPFRNEAENLPNLIETLLELNYPKHLFEILFINDDSKDDSVNIIKSFAIENATIIDSERNSLSPKKDAITTAIKYAKNNWIITTDADCFLPKAWLLTYDAFITKNHPKMIVAPVSYVTNNTFLEQFQLFDFLSLQSATHAGFGIKKPILCNGANFAYQTTIFKELSGFKGNNNIASGDDIFLLEKMTKKYPNELHYLKNKDALVYTLPEKTLKDLIHQRIRWASKTSASNNTFTKIVGIIIFTMNALIIATLILSITGVLTSNFFITILLLKGVIDYMFIKKSADIFQQVFCLRHYLISCLVYPVFSTAIVLSTYLFNFKWKDRMFKK